jgi:hypothetical protein
VEYWWWNDECSAAHTLARTASTHEEKHKANKALRNTVAHAKRTWAHEQLHHATNSKDIWRLAKTRKGHTTNSFLALCDVTNTLVDKPDQKSIIFQQKFFPAEPRHMEPSQHDDPPPFTMRTWDKITSDEVTKALVTTSPSSAPGPSSIGYVTLKWAHAARPEVLTDIFNLCIDHSTHPWKLAMVVVINKPHKPNYSIPKAYRPISLLECVGKVLEKIVACQINTDIESFGILPMTQFGSWPHYNAIDAVVTLVHHIQAT